MNDAYIDAKIAFLERCISTNEKSAEKAAATGRGQLAETLRRNAAELKQDLADFLLSLKQETPPDDGAGFQSE